MRLVMALALALAAMAPLSAQDSEMRLSIEQVKAKYQGELLAKPGVVSVGIAKGHGGTPIIVVGMDRDRPEVLRTLPKDLEGHAVCVEIIGTIRAQ